MPSDAPRDRFPESAALWQRASRRILGEVQTISKHPSSYAGGAGGCPVYAVRASGAYFEDADGNRILDYPLALGAIILGHAHPVVNEAVSRQLALGSLYSLSSPLEVELAELVNAVVPCAGKVRFFKTGSEATSAAVRVARAVTGRPVVAVCGYHGWHDWTAVRMPRKAGIPECLAGQVRVFAYNDPASLERIFSEFPAQVAAVIMEPVSNQAPLPGFLESVRDMARSNGAVLIFDEMITGFRLHLGGAQAHYGVTPDLATFGKAMSNGLPMAMLAGDAALLDDAAQKAFLTSTYGGDTLALSASLACIAHLVETDACTRLKRLGEDLQDGLNAVFKRTGFPARITGLAHKTFLSAESAGGRTAEEIETAFRRQCLMRGHFLGYGHFVSLSHTPEDIKKSCETAEEVCVLLRHRLESGEDIQG